jgi:hypothetical protein
MTRWNDHARPAQFTEPAKQAHKMAIAWVIARCEEDRGGNLDRVRLPGVKSCHRSRSRASLASFQAMGRPSKSNSTSTGLGLVPGLLITWSWIPLCWRKAVGERPLEKGLVADGVRVFLSHFSRRNPGTLSVSSVVGSFQGQILIRQLADYRFSG